jgi:hypothetical protein
MRMLVATHRTNGLAPGDYCFCVEGELVYMQDPCANDLDDPGGPCGCGRGFSGMNSHRAVTTALVVETDLRQDEVREALRSSLEAGGWLDPSGSPSGAWCGDGSRNTSWVRRSPDLESAVPVTSAAS